MRSALILAALIISLQTALAEEQKLTATEIETILSGKTVSGEKDGKAWQQMFQTSGLTIYIAGEASSNGTWKITGDQYCSQWPPNESWSCYDIAIDGETLTFISSTGERWPAKVLP